MDIFVPLLLEVNIHLLSIYNGILMAMFQYYTSY